MTGRRDQIASGLADVERRIAAACAAAGRERSEITLVAVTKTHPATDVAALAELGVNDVGENRHPEAGRKAAELAELRPGPQPRWHFLGGLQTNKVNAVARYADVVHSVDREKLVAALGRAAVAAEREITALVQIDFGSEVGRPSDGRSGVEPADAPALAESIAASAGLRLGGVMTVAPLGADPATVFGHLARISVALQSDHPEATIISAGMSDDMEAAVAAGATHLRVGRAILGDRPSLG